MPRHRPKWMSFSVTSWTTHSTPRDVEAMHSSERDVSKMSGREWDATRPRGRTNGGRFLTMKGLHTTDNRRNGMRTGEFVSVWRHELDFNCSVWIDDTGWWMTTRFDEKQRPSFSEKKWISFFKLFPTKHD